MARAKPRNTATRKKRAARSENRSFRLVERLPFGRILLFLGLALFLFMSIAAAGYVIFFRVVVAEHADRPLPAMAAAPAADSGLRCLVVPNSEKDHGVT